MERNEAAMIDIFGADRTWVFSGVGVFALGGFVWLIRRLVSRRSVALVQKQRSGAHSTNIQAGGNITVGGEDTKHGPR
jgi:hypothetical protein